MKEEPGIADREMSSENQELSITKNLLVYIGNAEARRRALTFTGILLLIIFWPFLFLFPYVLPIAGKYLAIGNDFEIWYFNYKVYLLDYMSRMRIPFWSPAEGAGYPFYSSALTQTFYPLNIPLAVFYRIFDGFTILDYQRYTILGISIFALGLFFWLRTFRFNMRSVLFSTLVIAVSFRMLELIRFPNAVHSAAWYPWILLLITKIFFSRRLFHHFLYGTGLFILFVLILTAGYPYYVYFLIFLVIPYFIIFFIRPVRSALFGDQKIYIIRSFVTFFLSGILALILCYPYLYKMVDLIQQAYGRDLGKYQYSTVGEFTPINTIGSFIFPPSSNFDGWYYFGITGVFLIFFFLISSALTRFTRQNDKEKVFPVLLDRFQNPWLILFFLGWFGVISYITYGEDSYLYQLLWDQLPHFSSIRFWRRLNIVLLPLLALLLAISYEYFEKFVMHLKENNHNRRNALSSSVYILGSTLMVFVFTQLILIQNGKIDERWTLFLVGAVNNILEYFTLVNGISNQVGIADIQQFYNFFYLFMALAAFIALYLIVIWVVRHIKKQKTLLNLVFIFLFMLSSFDIWAAGPWIWMKGPVENEQRTPLNIWKANRMSFQNVPRSDEYWSIGLGAGFNVGRPGIWYFDRYVKFRKWADSETEATPYLLGMVDGKKIFLSEQIDHNSVEMYLEDSDKFGGRVEMISYSGDILVVEVESSAPGYLSFIDNWEKDWIASIDDEEVPIHLLFGTFKSVKIPAGTHTIRFEYQPRFVSIFEFLSSLDDRGK